MTKKKPVSPHTNIVWSTRINVKKNKKLSRYNDKSTRTLKT